MAIAIPSWSPRTLRIVGGVRYLELRPASRGPAESQGVDTSGGSWAAPRLRWRNAAGHMRWLLAVGHFLDADGVAGAAW